MWNREQKQLLVSGGGVWGRVRSAWQAARGPPEHIRVLRRPFDGVCITSQNLLLSPAPQGSETESERERQHMHLKYIALQ